MTNPKERKGPSANSSYPTKTGEPIRKAYTDAERVEATLQTHKMWVNDPPGSKNCHFLDITSDEVGPNGVDINSEKPFDENAEWKYLEGVLRDKVSSETADRIQLAHQKLPELFRHIQSEAKITYPFKYDCITGEYFYPELEANLRKNAAQGIGKARATGFAIPVLGRLPQIFMDVYLLKCQLQMALRLLDIGTECSLRICIGKPCGGVRPLTVGHDDNVFLNGLAQQAIQQEIARLKIIPENICSYQKGKGCADATIVNGIVKEIALQSGLYYLAEIDDDAEKMFDRLYIELQAVLLLLAGAGMQGFTEWQCANMVNRTNRLITDIFVALLDYKCGLPQGSGFSVEIANLYAMFLLMWWNMDPINPEGTIAPFTSPRHGFPLLAGGITKLVSSLAYVDDAKRFVAVLKSEKTVDEFFEIVQGYCDLLADLSLVIKMGRNVRKCTVTLYNIPEDKIVPEFTSIAWSYDAQGPIKGNIAVVVMRRDQDNNLICYDVPKPLRREMPLEIQNIFSVRKYLGVATDAQLDLTDGKEKIISKMAQRIGLVSNKADCIQEAQISHNMLVCQVATFSPMCISMSLRECTEIDKCLIRTYQHRMNYMPSDAKHSIFISRKKGGNGVRSFTREYIGALLRDVEVYISNNDSLPTHTLLASIEAATIQFKWNLFKNGLIPDGTFAHAHTETLSLPGRKTRIYIDDPLIPYAEIIAHDYIHTMEKAVRTTSQLGFMLRDLNCEFISRFSDEIMLQDRYAKAIGSPLITTRASLGACIGEGNTHFFKFSMFGNIYLLMQMLVDELKLSAEATENECSYDRLYHLLTCPTTYAKKYTFLKGIIGPPKLATSAKKCINKFRADYKIGSFINLVEWRCLRASVSYHYMQSPRDQDYKIIITEENVFQPALLLSMHQNSAALSTHLRSILCLDWEANIPEANDLGIDDLDPDTPISNEDVIFHATQHDLPMFVSMDGSLERGVATISISVVAPDISDSDEAQEWQDRPAKILLIRSWRLPSQWGTGLASINMAEAVGFILGDYTIPADLPVIYITDSNNARTLQRKVKCGDSLTHRQKIRQVMQGIDSSIANHLEYLTSKWPSEDQLSEHTKDMYRRGEDICNLWAKQEKIPNIDYQEINTSCSQHTTSAEDPNDDSDTLSDNESHASYTEKLADCPVSMEKNRYKFNPSMYDCFGRVSIIKVYSHQLNSDFLIKTPGKQPRPNLFIVSANQVVDNAATQAIRVTKSPSNEYDCCYYPPFSPRWCFSFEGKLTTKGATTVLQDRLDYELVLRQQHREKHGLYLRLAAHSSLHPDLIGDESLLRCILKMTAVCMTRCIYRYPPLVNQIWGRWRDTQTEKDYYDQLPLSAPKDWQKRTGICNYVIKACPFCSSSNSVDNKKGNLEHLHIYCPSKHLMKVRSHCNGKIEEALFEIYNAASMRQYHRPFDATGRSTLLQEKLLLAAKEAELQERLILKDSQVVAQMRTGNIAIRSRADILMDIFLRKLPDTKLTEYDTFPLSSQIGFIHALPEQELVMSTATVTDVGFLGLFPKKVFQVLKAYAAELEQSYEDVAAFLALQDRLFCAFIYRPIALQKVIHILIAAFKSYLDKLDKRREASIDMEECDGASDKLNTSSQKTEGSIISPTASPSTFRRKCFAIKCRILQAKGMLRKPMTCATNRNVCSGCCNEAAKQTQVTQLEQEIVQLSIDNASLAPLLDYGTQPVSNKKFRKMWNCLPTFGKKSRNDYKFGAATYLANTLGILLKDTSSSHTMDEPLTTKQSNDLWRQASHFCKCHDPARPARNTLQVRMFCYTCAYIIPCASGPKCPGCNLQDSHLLTGTACLSCKFATVAFRNPYHRRLASIVDTWLSPSSDSDSSTSNCKPSPQSSNPKTPYSSSTVKNSHQDLLNMRKLSYERSFHELRSKSTPEENKLVFTNIAMLQRDFQRKNSEKRDLQSLLSDTNEASQTEDDNFSPRKRGILPTATALQSINGDASYLEESLSAKKLFSDDSCTSIGKNLNRTPLLPLDMNNESVRTRWTKGSTNQVKRDERTMKAKARKKEKCIKNSKMN